MRIKKSKDGQLFVRYRNGIQFCYPKDNVLPQQDYDFVQAFLEKFILEEFSNREYNLNTLEFSIFKQGFFKLLLRIHKPKPKKGQILVKYGKEEYEEKSYDILYCRPANTCNMSRDAIFLMFAFNNKQENYNCIFLTELKNRGYDLKSLYFSIYKNNIQGSDI